MPDINYQRKEVNFKIVYYGPGMSGKTTNLIYIHRAMDQDRTGKMVKLDTEEERTLFFDFMPVNLGKVCGLDVGFNMYTVPGQVYYEASRRMIMDGVDAVIFVADSQPDRLDNNIELYEMLEDNLRFYNFDPNNFPIVLQYNKRDCDAPIEVGTLEKTLDIKDTPVYTSIATEGIGVMNTMRKACQMAIEKFRF